MRIHLIAPFNTVPSKSYSYDPYSGKVLRFSKMIQRYGYKVYEYSNFGSQSQADEIIPMLSTQELSSLGTLDKLSIFDLRLRTELYKRIKDGDIIAHTYGMAHSKLLSDIKNKKVIHIETGVGYSDPGFGAYRVFESQAWRHYHWGQYDLAKNSISFSDYANNSYVVPMYFDIDEFPIIEETNKFNDSNYVLYLGRISPDKGIFKLSEIIKQYSNTSTKEDKTIFMIAGPGDYNQWLIQSNFSKSQLERIHYVGLVIGDDRAPLLGNAICTLMPTEYPEPFGASGVEGMLTGTPLLSSDFGAFTETVAEGITGYRCRTLDDWVNNIKSCLRKEIDRLTVAAYSRAKYSLENCGKLFNKIFYQISNRKN